MKASKTVTHGDSSGFQLRIVQWEPRTWVQNFLLRRSNVGVIKEKIRRPLRHIGGARQRSLPRRMERDGTLADATCMILFRWACWARFLLLFGCFGTSQNGLSKLVPAMGRCGIRPSQNGLSKLVPAMGRCGIRLVFLGRQYATLEIRGVALGRHVGHDSCCCSAVSEPANGLSKLVSARGRCGRSFVFLGRQYATLEIRGALRWEGMLGTIPAAVRLFRNQPMDSQSWFLQGVGVA